MITSSLSGYLTCDEPKCEAKAQTELFLTLAGGFTFKPHKGWQVLGAANAPEAPYLTRCPLHHQKQNLIQPSAAIPGLRSEH